MLPLTLLSSIYLSLHLSDLTSSCSEFKQSPVRRYGKRKLRDILEVYSNMSGVCLSAVLQIPNRNAWLCFKNDSPSLLQFLGFTSLSFLSLTMSYPVVPFLFSQVSICFLNSSNSLLSCLRIFFVVELFVFLQEKEKHIQKANCGSSFHFHFGL